MDEPVSAYDLAKSLRNHPQVAEVRASERSITIAHVTEEHAEAIPTSLFEYINEQIADTEFTWEYSNPSPETVERHSVTGGASHDAIAGPLAPERCELQVSLVRSR